MDICIHHVVEIKIRCKEFTGENKFHTFEIKVTDEKGNEVTITAFSTDKVEAEF